MVTTETPKPDTLELIEQCCFTDAEGREIRSFAHLRDGKVVWMADFTDFTLERVDAIKELFPMKDALVEQCLEIISTAA